MVNQTFYNLGTAPSVIRQLFAYGLEQAKLVGPENVFDYSLGNPSIPAPKKVNASIHKIVDETDSIHLHGYSMAPGFEEARAAVAAPLSAAVQEAFRRALAGRGFAVGTPGSVGGALRMNAGSRDEWLGARVESVTSFSAEGGLVRRHGSEIEWGYRCSSFPADEILVECELNMEPADPFYIRGKMEASLKRRKATQPLRQPSCGSVFKNPEGASAGDLIERAGLKGSAVGGARISDVHANFIVNTGNATAHDVLSLIEFVQGKVSQAYGIALKPEVRLLGFE